MHLYKKNVSAWRYILLPLLRIYYVLVFDDKLQILEINKKKYNPVLFVLYTVLATVFYMINSNCKINVGPFINEISF